MKIKVIEFTTRVNNTLQGFLTVYIPSLGMEIPGFTLHQKGDNRWLEVPGRPLTNAQENGIWTKVLGFTSKLKEARFKKQVLEDLDRFLKTEMVA